MLIELTTAQQRALLKLADPDAWWIIDGLVRDGHGVGFPTARNLVNQGLAEWAEEPHIEIHPGHVSRTRYQWHWSMRMTDLGRRALTELQR